MAIRFTNRDQKRFALYRAGLDPAENATRRLRSKNRQDHKSWRLL